MLMLLRALAPVTAMVPLSRIAPSVVPPASVACAPVPTLNVPVPVMAEVSMKVALSDDLAVVDHRADGNRGRAGGNGHGISGGDAAPGASPAAKFAGFSKLVLAPAPVKVNWVGALDASSMFTPLVP